MVNLKYITHELFFIRSTSGWRHQMAFKKPQTNNNYIIILLNYITQKRNITKIIKKKVYNNVHDKICIELYILFISFYEVIY